MAGTTTCNIRTFYKIFAPLCYCALYIDVAYRRSPLQEFSRPNPLAPEKGTDMLFRKSGRQLPTYAA
jgi:hypothetical protein